MTKVAEAIELLGGPAKAARALNVSLQAAAFWRTGQRRFPADLCPSVERLTQGRIRCEDLRPDVDWAYLRCCAHEDLPAQELSAQPAPAAPKHSIRQLDEKAAVCPVFQGMGE